MSEHEEYDELMEYINSLRLADEELDRRSDTIDCGWATAEALKRLVLADLHSKEEFSEVPAFEDVMTEEGIKKRPNEALRRILQVYSENVGDAKPWEKDSQLYGLMSERERLAQAWSEFGWKQQPASKSSELVKAAKKRLKKLQKADQMWMGTEATKISKHRLTKAELKLLHPEDEAPDPNDLETYRTTGAGSWVIYSPEEKAHFDLNEQNRREKMAWDLDKNGHPIIHRGGFNAREQDEYNSQCDLSLRDDMDMVLPDYPVFHHDDKAVTEALDMFADFTRDYPFGEYEDRTRFCDWIRARGGINRLHDAVDNLKYYHNHAPRLNAAPIIMIKGIKMLTREWDFTRISKPVFEPGFGWGYPKENGDFMRLNTEFIVTRAESLMSRWLCEEPTLRPRINMRNSGLIHPVGWDTTAVRFRELKAGSRILRQSHCDTCSKRITEKNDWYWQLVNSLSGMFATQYKESMEYGCHTLFVKDDVDCRWTQKNVLGDHVFNSPDVWKISGKTGNWRCLLCGRNKIFRSYVVLMQWTTGASYNKSKYYENGQPVLTMYKTYGKTYVVKLRIAGERYLDRLQAVVD